MRVWTFSCLFPCSYTRTKSTCLVEHFMQIAYLNDVSEFWLVPFWTKHKTEVLQDRSVIGLDFRSQNSFPKCWQTTPLLWTPFPQVTEHWNEKKNPKHDVLIKFIHQKIVLFIKMRKRLVTCIRRKSLIYEIFKYRKWKVPVPSVRHAKQDTASCRKVVW